MQKRTLDKGTLTMMLMVSVIVDIGQLFIDLIPFAGWAINIYLDFCIAWIFFLWFKYHDVQFSKGPLAAFATGIVLDAIPFISAFAWTLDVLMVYTTAKTNVLK